MKKMNGKTMDILAENIKELRQIFPEVFTENKINFDVLKSILGDYVDDQREYYNFTWNGKNEARMTSQIPSNETLRPCPKESVNWENTQNIFIEGDNLEVLKLLQKSYHKKVKMIYIDPPYNTGKDFIYKDNFKNSIRDYKEITRQIDSEGRDLSSNPETSGRYHTGWLNMMYPRLRLARNLLKDDGIIVVHIDENEYPNLEKILSEIYGEENNLGTIIWDKRNPKGDATGIAQQHELISFYCKNREFFKKTNEFKRPKENAKTMLKKVLQLISSKGKITESIRKDYKDWLKKQDFSTGDKAYCLIDENGDVYRHVSMAWPNKKKAPESYFIPLIHPKTKKECPIPARGWRNPPTTMAQLQKNGLILFGKDETTQPNRKYLLKENLYENIPSLLYYGGSDDALLSKLGVWFDTPKVVEVSKKLISPICKNNDILLDFFAGSATSAHAILKLNAEDNANRRFIMVQLPEPCNIKSVPYLSNYKTIAEISKKRIRKAAEQLRMKNTGYDGDLGFKVFKLDSTNIKSWDADFDTLDKDYLKQMLDNIKNDRNEEDVLYEILIKNGFDLTLQIIKHVIDGHTVFDVAAGTLIVCLSNNITLETVEGIIQLKNKLKPNDMQIVFRDYGFKDERIKSKAFRLFKQADIRDIRSL